MQIAFHIGANCTDADRLLKSILKNADRLLTEGIAVPGPGRYRTLIRETITALDGAKPAADTRDILLDTIVENDNIQRVVLSNDNFICIPNRIFDHGLLYSQAAAKTHALKQLFKEDDIALFLGIRNPSSFVQDAFERSNASSMSEYLGLMRPQEIRWSDVVRRIKQAVPEVPLTVWCNEDSPLLWEQLIRAISGVSAQTPVDGGLDMLSTIISRAGMKTLQQRLAATPTRTDAERHEIIADVWETHAIDDRIEDEIQLTELDPALVDQMTQMYDDDVDRIGNMAGVNMTLPFS